jgi:acyl-coenzyme A synthetase/AMP-(fatty) acid ligase
VAGDADRILAIRSDGVVSAGEFLVQARALASRLPESPFVINLCESRYRFALGFVAAMLRGQITLLPSNRAPKALERVESLYPGAYRLNDPEVADLETVGWAGSICPPNDLRGSNDSLGNAALMPNLQAGRELSESGFTIPADRTVAIVFTSGSTGDPQPHLKTWGIYCHSARLIAESLGIKRFAADALVATVPPQHMYGLELSVLLPLCWGGRLYDGKPFFPADVADVLAELTAPRFLVTTPVHLRACVESGTTFPAIEGLVSATAPLSGELTARAEKAFGCEVQEIYGCSEAGSLARRRTVEGDVWQSFPGVEMVEGLVRTDFLPQAVPIQDVVEVVGPGKFRLLGRGSDLINIAGKRTSLAALNHALLEIPGVCDGVFFSAEGDRLMAAVVAPGVDRQTLFRELQTRIDPVFLPRPLHLVDRLPRAETGKLTRQALDAMIAGLAELP